MNRQWTNLIEQQKQVLLKGYEEGLQSVGKENTTKIADLVQKIGEDVTVVRVNHLNRHCT